MTYKSFLGVSFIAVKYPRQTVAEIQAHFEDTSGRKISHVLEVMRDVYQDRYAALILSELCEQTYCCCSMDRLYGMAVPAPDMEADAGETKNFFWLSEFFNDRFSPNGANGHDSAAMEQYLILWVYNTNKVTHSNKVTQGNDLACLKLKLGETSKITWKTHITHQKRKTRDM